MPNNQNRTGRAKRGRRHDGPNFIQLYRYMLDCPAYVSLSVWARAALIEVIRGYNGSNNGKIILSVRDLARRLGCHRDTACDALQELVDKGFIERRIKGAFSVKFKRATEWRLNDRRCDATGVRQSQAFLKWQGPRQPPAKSNTVLRIRTERSYRTGHYADPGTVATVLQIRTLECVSRSYRTGRFYIYQSLAAMCAADDALETPLMTNAGGWTHERDLTVPGSASGCVYQEHGARDGDLPG